MSALALALALALAAVVDELLEFFGVSACFVCRADGDDDDEAVNFGSLDTGAVVMTAVGMTTGGGADIRPRPLQHGGPGGENLPRASSSGSIRAQTRNSRGFHPFLQQNKLINNSSMLFRGVYCIKCNSSV